MNILAITQEDPINYSSLGLVRFMHNIPALFWFPFSVYEMLVNCDSLQHFVVVFHLKLQVCIFRKAWCKGGFSHPTLDVQLGRENILLEGLSSIH